MAQCGNGVVEPTEECDDGNLAAGDCCSTDCHLPVGILAGPIVNPTTEHRYYLLYASSWSDAEAQAVCLGGHLVTVNDAAEDAWVWGSFSTFGGESRNLWIGLTDEAQEGTFVWTSGQPVTYTRWRFDQPDNATGNENYCHMWLPDGFWNDYWGFPTSLEGAPLNGVVEVSDCGNGIPDPGEECDDGNTNPADGCTNWCTICGNGRVSAYEQCDDGNLLDHDGCNADCRFPVCGDGVVDPDEECDDGNTTPCDGCSPTCTTDPPGFRCGDGIVSAACGEECDDGNTSDNDACHTDCRANFCGDGFVNPAAEQCDDGNTYACDGCSAQCEIEPPGYRCGDGIVSAACGEVCDDGNMNDADACLTNCRPNACGDGYVDPDAEECDDGNRNGYGGCTLGCTVCGNGTPTPPEECDDGNRVNGDGCTTACTVCGNGVVTAPEQCDDGNRVDADVCGGGCRWTGLNAWTDIGPDSPVTALVIAPTIPPTLYAGSRRQCGGRGCWGVDGVFKSTDGGATWDATSVGAAVLALAVDSTTPALYVGTDGGLFRSTDAGATWIATGLMNVSVGRLAIDPLSPATLFAQTEAWDGQQYRGGLSKSTDGATTWQPLALNGDDVTLLGIDPLNPTTLYAETGFFDIGWHCVNVMSLDGGTNWTAMGPTDSCLRALAVDPQSTSTLYAGRFGVGVLKSTNGGTTWAAVGLADALVGVLAVDPRHPSTVYAGTDTGVFETSDGGSTWRPLRTGLPGWGVTELAIDPVDSRRLYAATNGIGVYAIERVAACTGDCAADGAVTVDDVVTEVNVALGDTPIVTCGSGDGNGDGRITIDEIIQAVNVALDGCAVAEERP